MASNGVYGTNIPSLITEDDVEIYYSYRPNRNDDSEESRKFTKLSSNILTQSTHDNAEGKYDNILEGLYNLKLPLEKFNKKGIYTIYIKPRELEGIIKDISVLSSYPDVRGLILDMEDTDIEEDLAALLNINNGLVGYRIIYYDNGERESTYRLITSNNKVEPVVQSVSQGNQKFTRYRYNDSSSLVFLTVTPSTAPTFKSTASPFIGNTSQKIAIVNTKFEPIMLEVEMVEHDDETITTMLEGSQLRDLDHGLITTFNSDNEIYAQHEFYSLKDQYTAKPIYEVKKEKNESIDFNQTITDK